MSENEGFFLDDSRLAINVFDNKNKGFSIDDSHLKGNIFEGLIVNGTTTSVQVKGKNRSKGGLPENNSQMQKE